MGIILIFLLTVLAISACKSDPPLPEPDIVERGRRIFFDFKPIEIAYDHDALWFYILKEAAVQNNGEKLGSVGSTIVCATFAGLLKGDPCSYLNVEPCWTPNDDRELVISKNQSHCIEFFAFMGRNPLRSSGSGSPVLLKMGAKLPKPRCG